MLDFHLAQPIESLLVRILEQAERVKKSQRRLSAQSLVKVGLRRCWWWWWWQGSLRSLTKVSKIDVEARRQTERGN